LSLLCPPAESITISTLAMPWGLVVSRWIKIGVYEEIDGYGKPAVSYKNIKIKRGVAQIHILTK
jgi:hypothetical protein